MHTRKEIRDKINVLVASIIEQKKELRELQERDMLFSDNEQWYSEEFEFLRGIDNNSQGKRVLVGRINWVESFMDEDTGKIIPIIRSKIVKAGGEWWV